VPESPMGRRVQEDYYVSPSKDGGAHARGGVRRDGGGRDGGGRGLNPFDEEEEEEGVSEEMLTTPLPRAEGHAGAGGAAPGDGAGDGGEEEAQLHASRALYARALRLLDPPPRDGDGGGQEPEVAYRALLEGAGRFVCLARRLVLQQGEGGWDAALALLDRLHAASCGRAHHQVFAFLLGRALGAADLGRMEAVMARRPPALTVADVWALARRLRQEEQELDIPALDALLSSEGGSPRLCMASLKHSLLLLLQRAAE
jgi:hypothetical protein